jgi:hypothetical protein
LSSIKKINVANATRYNILKLMKTLVVYKSYLGSSAKYAGWIAEKVNAETRVFNQAKNNYIDSFDTVVIVSGTYAGRMPLVRFLKKHWKSLKEKNVVAVAVGAAPEKDSWSIKSFESIPEDIRTNITYFKLPSSIEKKGREALKKSNVEPVLDYLTKIK